MVEREQSADDSTLHRNTVFESGVRAVLSTVVFGALGAVAGHYMGRWGEENRAGSGMSALLGRWITGGLFGGLAAYVSLRGSAEHEHQRAQLEQKNAELEQKVKVLEAHLPEQNVQAAASEHHGAVAVPSLSKAL